MAIKHDESLAYLPITDHNKSTAQLVKKKKSILLAFDALENVCERLMDKMFNLQKEERALFKTDQNAYHDSLITILLRINKRDIKNVKKYIETFVYNDSIKSIALWSFLNTT